MTPVVCRFERFCDPLRDRQRLIEGDDPARQPLRQILASFNRESHSRGRMAEVMEVA
jgi:hypothetical protein